MTHTLFTKGLNLLAALTLISGISLSASQTMVMASLSGQGSNIVDRGPMAEEFHSASTIVPINTYQHVDAGIQLILGILLIVLGFFIHGLARSTGERPVHITVTPSPKKRPLWFWMEMKI